MANRASISENIHKNNRNSNSVTAPSSISNTPIRSDSTTPSSSSHHPRNLVHHPMSTSNPHYDRDRSSSLSSPIPTVASAMNISTSPVMPFLPNLSLTSNNSLSMSPPHPLSSTITTAAVNNIMMSKRWSISSSSGAGVVEDIFPQLSQQNQKAVDDALSSERSRIKELEKKENESDLSVEDIKLILKRERSRMTKIVGELAALKSMSVASQAEAEVCEEGRINGLMRRMDSLQKEKGRIIVELEREEEMLTNTLQKKLNEVRREKAELEKQIEKEHSYNLELKAKLDKMECSRPHTAISIDSSTPSLKSENMNEE